MISMRDARCPMENAFDVLSPEAMRSLIKSNWELIVLEIIANGYNSSYSDIHDASGLNPKVLINTLKKLESEGMVSRRMEGRRPRYSITAKSKILLSAQCPLLSYIKPVAYHK